MTVRERLREQDGMTLPELLIAMVFGVSLLGLTLGTFERFVVTKRDSDRRNEVAEQARSALDVQARQLRNLAKRTQDPVINRVTTDDFVFQTSDPTRTWIRYCLDASAGADRARIWQMTQSADTPGVTTICGAGASGWSRKWIVAPNVVNRIDGRDQPLFSYRCVNPASACTASPDTWDQIIGVDAEIYVDTTPRTGPPEQKVASGVYLRNQNQAPTAAMSWVTVTSSPRTVKLNASGSDDYEGRTLEYYWFLGAMPPKESINCAKPVQAVDAGGTTRLWGGGFIGRGVVLQYTWPGSSPSSGTPQTVGLVACDPGDRFGYASSDKVLIP